MIYFILIGLFISFLVNLRLIDEVRYLKLSRKKIYYRLDDLEKKRGLNNGTKRN